MAPLAPKSSNDNRISECVWVRKFADVVCTFYGEDFRDKAEDAAREEIKLQGVGEDPGAAAILFMEGLEMRSDL